MLKHGKCLKNNRSTVLVTCKGTSYLLSVPPLESSSGEKQIIAIMNLIAEFEIPDHLIGTQPDQTQV